MSSSRRSPFVHAVAVAVTTSAVIASMALLAGCDQLNKPFGNTSSSSSSSGSGATTTGTDGGGPSIDDGGVSPAPTIRAQPGDIQL